MFCSSFKWCEYLELECETFEWFRQRSKEDPRSLRRGFHQLSFLQKAPPIMNSFHTFLILHKKYIFDSSLTFRIPETATFNSFLSTCDSFEAVAPRVAAGTLRMTTVSSSPPLKWKVALKNVIFISSFEDDNIFQTRYWLLIKKLAIQRKNKISENVFYIFVGRIEGVWIPNLCSFTP